MRKIRVVSWNLNGAIGGRAAGLGELLASKGPVDLALLQEADSGGAVVFCEHAELDWCISVDDAFGDLLVARGRHKPNARRPRGVAIAGRGPSLRGATTLPDVPLPEKLLVGWLDLAGVPVTVASYHAPTGVHHHEKKPQQAVQFARWLVELEGPIVIGADFNTPEVDHPDQERIRTHWHSGNRNLRGEPGDDLLVGPNEIHPLNDALRLWLAKHPDEMDRIRAHSPDGPLTVSHRTGTKKNPRRYDAIWVTPHFDVEAVKYWYEEAVEAGTDHALVVADLDLSMRD